MPNSSQRYHRGSSLWNNKNGPSNISQNAPMFNARHEKGDTSVRGAPKISRSENKSNRENRELLNTYNLKSSFVHFSISDLKLATNDFANGNLIGRGGFSEVYKGRLGDGQLVAVKKLMKGEVDERTSNFLSELGIIAHIDHPNIAKLIGCGADEEEMHIVFQLSALGSLGSLLHGPNKNELNWTKRYRIAMGIANGLYYLHEQCQRRIIHRDIKSDNILLTENFEPQICDFGIARWLPEQCPYLSPCNMSKLEGTCGYFAPEYLTHGKVGEKNDVYSYGIVLLEIITGRRALDHLQQSIMLWAKPLLDTNNIKNLVDPSLGDDYDRKEMDRVVLTASLCVEQSPLLRPRMSQVIVLLKGDDVVMELPEGSPPLWYDQRTYS
ncbi:hypothetical protein RIF29_24880 [Crotalaria pallida]|uniref:non-specific serine/threonine protein kinase n=1 Tax=Crotalaria pallida TaxID=3830 RepID=A0AAN9ESS2_CROPI